MSTQFRILGVWITDPEEFTNREKLGTGPRPVAFVFVRGGLAFRYMVLNPGPGRMSASEPVDLHLRTYAYENDNHYLILYDVHEPPDSDPFVAPWSVDPDGRLLIFENGDWSNFVAETSAGAAERLGIPDVAFRELRAEIENMGHGWVDKGVIESVEA